MMTRGFSETSPAPKTGKKEKQKGKNITKKQFFQLKNMKNAYFALE